MKPVAKYIQTPIGRFNFPLDPSFLDELDQCQTIYDLFELVEPAGFINPDAFSELIARDLVREYELWLLNKKANK